MNILIINGHPDKASLTSQIATKKYTKLKDHGHQMTLLNLSDLDFDPVFTGFSDHREMEADLIKAQNLIKEAEHIIITSPIWWSTYPALLKGFFDRTFLPGFAFKYHKGKTIPEKLLKGKTAELILLSDAPVWYRKFIQRDPAALILKRDILGFCGIKLKKVQRIGSVSSKDKEQRLKILNNI